MDIRIRLPNNWEPRPYQLPSWIAWEKGCKRQLLIWHRRAGKDDTQLHLTCFAAHQRIGNYWHCLPLYSQARKAIWEAINPLTGKRRINEAFPPEIRVRTNNSDMSIELACGSMWRVVGSDDPNTLVGAPPVGICFSEWALSNPAAWAYLAPILVENKGWASFITTVRGRNHVWDMLQLARSDPWSQDNPSGWYSEVLTPKETGFDLDLVEKQRHEYHKIFGEETGDALIEQEYWCSFDAAVLGSYYGKVLAMLDRAGRITDVPYDPELPVHTAWDLGKGANMFVWLWQIYHDEVRIIGEIEGAHDDTIPDICAKLDRLPYRWGLDWVPHDARVKELGTGKTRVETLAALKRKPQLVPAHKVEDGISAARLMTAHCWIDAARCPRGLRFLRLYRADWDTDRKVFRNEPFHDESSHAADGYRYIAMAWKEIRQEIVEEPEGRTIHRMTLDEAWELRERENRI